jgi:hypothetical protein
LICNNSSGAKLFNTKEHGELWMAVGGFGAYEIFVGNQASDVGADLSAYDPGRGTVV